jgi:molecular chaperone GrpE
MPDPREPQTAPDETPADIDTPTRVDAAEDLALVIESKRAESEAALAEQREKYLRLAAEYENFRKRAVRDRENAEHSGQASVVRGLLDALDDLARFAHLDPGATDVRTVVDGAALVEQKLLKSLAGHGLELVNPTGQPFDPTFHEAVSTVPATAADEDHLVAQVYQVGYVLRGQLLRPARVVVKQWAG